VERPFGLRTGAVVRTSHHRGQRRHDSGREHARIRHEVRADIPGGRGKGAPDMSRARTNIATIAVALIAIGIVVVATRVSRRLFESPDSGSLAGDRPAGAGGARAAIPPRPHSPR